MMSHEAEDREDDKTCVDTGSTVGDADDDAVSVGTPSWESS